MRQQPLTVFNFKKNTSTEHFYHIYKAILVISDDELEKNSHLKFGQIFFSF